MSFERPTDSDAMGPAGAPGAEAGLTAAEQRTLLRLARGALAEVLEGRPLPQPTDLGLAATPALRQHRGAFVSIYNGRTLRGCRGQLDGNDPLFRAVMIQAAETALRDHRFEPVDRAELPDVRLVISALTATRAIDGVHQIELGRHGIILSKANRRAVFLPQVASGAGWDLATTLGRLARKAGLPVDGWREGATFEVFEAEVIAERGADE